MNTFITFFFGMAFGNLLWCIILSWTHTHKRKKEITKLLQQLDQMKSPLSPENTLVFTSESRTENS